jgi:hypothetical protein
VESGANNPNVIGALEENQGGLEKILMAAYAARMSERTDPTERAQAALRARMASHIDAALACLDEISDPIERERAARILADDLLPDAGQRVKSVRGAVVQELRTARGLKLREVSELTGLSIPRIDQLAKGR